MWVLGAAETPADVLDDLRGMCPDLRLHSGDDPPTETCDVLMLWAEADVSEVDAKALEARRSGLARVVAIVAPGAHGTLQGHADDEPSHVVKIDPAWGSSGIATVLQGALAGARESARAEEIAEAQESFVAIASHDLRTPVSTLRLLHDLFRSKLNAGAAKYTPGELSDIEELLDIMERNLEKMDGFIGDILEAWRLYRGRPQLATEAVSLNSVAEDIVAGLFPAAMKKDIALDSPGVSDRWSPTWSRTRSSTRPPAVPSRCARSPTGRRGESCWKSRTRAPASPRRNETGSSSVSGAGARGPRGESPPRASGFSSAGRSSSSTAAASGSSPSRARDTGAAFSPSGLRQQHLRKLATTLEGGRGIRWT
jgi:hypothetical protein